MRQIKIIIFAAVLLLSAQQLNAQCIALSSGFGTDNQTVCINTPITPIVYTLAPTVTNVIATGFPAGVIGLFDAFADKYTITGTPSVAGSYTYVLTTIGCSGVMSGFITVNQNSTITLTSPLPTTSQTVCVNKPVTNIVYSIGGGGTGATVTGLPNGVTGTYGSGSFTISGTPTAAGTYGYTVTTTGPCIQATATGSIKVNPDASITLTSDPATNNQAVCINNAITPVTYAISGGGTGAGVAGLPTGVTGSYSAGVFTISGTPSVSGTFNYTITTTGTCAQATATGTIIVNQNSTISLTSGAGTNNQTRCINTAITNITYSVGGGGTGAGVSGLPTGVTGSYSGGVFTISGIPTVSGTFNYIVTTTGPCVNVSATGTIKVNPDAVITLTSAAGTNNQNVCVNSAITGITYSITGGGTGAGVTGLPAGVTGTFSGGVFTISGIPTVTGTFNYIVTTTGTCVQATATGTIISALNATITLTSAAGTNIQTVCAGTAIASITYSIAGSATDAAATGLPAGVTGTYLSGIFTISGIPTTAGVFNYTVTTIGTCTQTTATGTITIIAIPVATASNNGPLCVGSPLNLTGGPAGMTTYSWTGPNSFTSNQRSPQVSTAATAAMAGKYILTVTNANGCRDTASTRAYVYVVPVANAGTGGTECDLSFVLNAVPSVGIGLWSIVTGPGTASFSPDANTAGATVTVSAYGTYTFRWTETNGPCSSDAVITVNFYQQPVANAGAGGNECDLDFVLSAVPSVGTGDWTLVTGPGTALFSPDAATPGAKVSVSAYGTYSFRWTETNGTCTSNATVTVNFYQQPVANAGTGGNNCGTQFNLNATPSVGTGTWTRVSGPGTANFSPNANSATAKVTITVYGTYTFRWTEVNGTCSSNASINVTFIQQPSANAGNGGDECDKTFALNAILTSGTGTWTLLTGPGTATFSPDANHPNATVTVSQFGAYDFQWTVVNSLCTSSDAIRVTFHDLPAVSAGADLAVCKGSSIQLNATGTGTFLWTPANLLNNPAIPNPVATPVKATVFTVTLTDQYQCKNSDQVNVEVRTKPVADAGPDQVLEYLFETTLDGSALSANQTGEWTILSGSGDFADINNPVSAVSNLALGINSFVWTVSNGVCQPPDADTVKITVHDLVIPTLITPNQDGKNDYFVINGIETLGNTSLLIFNRWGARVFENSKYDNKWDGVDNKNNPLPEDTYFFILRPEKSKAISGYVVIRR
jgi:gliding motility-associated-like protein